MHYDTACQAVRKGVCLELRYDDFTRTVEVHAVGTSTAGNVVMRVWQVRGGGVHNESVGWALMRLDEVANVVLTNEKSEAPRPGYRRGDKGMQRIFCEL